MTQTLFTSRTTEDGMRFARMQTTLEETRFASLVGRAFAQMARIKSEALRADNGKLRAAIRGQIGELRESIATLRKQFNEVLS